MEDFSNLLFEHQVQLALWALIPLVIVLKAVGHVLTKNPTVYHRAIAETQKREQIKKALGPNNNNYPK